MPQVSVKIQQTPKPEAHLPEAEPPNCEQSLELYVHIVCYGIIYNEGSELLQVRNFSKVTPFLSLSKVSLLKFSENA